MFGIRLSEDDFQPGSHEKEDLRPYCMAPVFPLGFLAMPLLETQCGSTMSLT